jgi:transposase
MVSGKTYPWEFRNETVKLITEGGASAFQIAKDLDLPVDTLYKWIKELSSKQEEEFPGRGQVTSDAEIIRLLKRENERLKVECEILKNTRDTV